LRPSLSIPPLREKRRGKAPPMRKKKGEKKGGGERMFPFPRKRGKQGTLTGEKKKKKGSPFFRRGEKKSLQREENRSPPHWSEKKKPLQEKKEEKGRKGERFADFSSSQSEGKQEKGLGDEKGKGP